MKKILTVLSLFFCVNSYALNIDLTNPEQVALADVYPNYDRLALASFKMSRESLATSYHGTSSIFGDTNEGKGKGLTGIMLFEPTISSILIHWTDDYWTNDICKNNEGIIDSIPVFVNAKILTFNLLCTRGDPNWFAIFPRSKTGLSIMLEEMSKDDYVFIKIKDSQRELIFLTDGFESELEMMKQIK